MPDKETSSLEGVNKYAHQLSEAEIRKGKHRLFVGGLWKELGLLQLEFLKRRGLQPHHQLLDIGCGCLRGGIHFIRYLEPGRYFGIDANPSLIRAARVELAKARLADKPCQLLADDAFRLDEFQTDFDFMIAISVFTHLPMNHIIHCLHAAQRQLKPDGVLYATFFQAPDSIHVAPLRQTPDGSIVTHYDQDPFHYSSDEIGMMAGHAGLTVEPCNDWDHPRNQKMFVFRK